MNYMQILKDNFVKKSTIALLFLSLQILPNIAFTSMKVCNELFLPERKNVSSNQTSPDARTPFRNETANQEFSQYFSSLEFPNFLLPSRNRHDDLLHLNFTERRTMIAEIAKTKNALEQALFAIFSRMTVPVTDTNGKTSTVRLFSILPKIIHEIDLSARVQPSGGVIRSVLGLIYKEIYVAIKQNPSLDHLSILYKISNFEHPLFDTMGDISADRIRGVGSDFDIILDMKDPSKLETVQKVIKTVLNSAADFYMDRSNRNEVNKAVFSIGDIKPNFEHNGKPGQIQRSVVQGGSTLDYLSFDLENRRLVEPKQHPKIIRDFILGFYTYTPATGRRENHSATVLRGLRSLLELPFLRLKNEALLKLELQNLISQANNGSFPNEKALEQIDKIFRNARMSAANNRLHRSSPNHPLSLFKKLVQILQKAKSEGKLRTNQTLDLPVFAREMPLNRSLDKLPFILKQSVISAEDFQIKYLIEGKIFHGTPSVEAALSIIRGGFHETLYEKGLRRGAYFSPFQSNSAVYTRIRSSNDIFKNHGLVFDLNIRPGVHPNVVDLRKNMNEVKNFFEKEANGKGVEMADLLASEYGIDVIILSDFEMLIKNTAILSPVTFSSLIHSIGVSLKDNSAPVRERVQRYMMYRGLYPYGQSIGIKNLPTIPSVSEMTNSLYNDFSDKQAWEFVMSFYDLEVAKLLNEDDKIQFNEFVKKTLTWEHFDLEQMLWSYDFSKVMSPEAFKSLFENRAPVNGTPEQIEKYISFMFVANDFIPLTSDFKVFVQRYFSPEFFRNILNQTSHPHLFLRVIFDSNLLMDEQISNLKEFYKQRLSQAVKSNDSKIGFEALAILYNINVWHKNLSIKDLDLINQSIDSLARNNALEFWNNPNIIEWWSESLFLLSDSIVEPILIYAIKNGLVLDIHKSNLLNLHARALKLEKWSTEMRAVMNKSIKADALDNNLIGQVQSHP